MCARTCTHKTASVNEQTSLAFRQRHAGICNNAFVSLVHFDHLLRCLWWSLLSFRWLVAVQVTPERAGRKHLLWINGCRSTASSLRFLQGPQRLAPCYIGLSLCKVCFGDRCVSRSRLRLQRHVGLLAREYVWLHTDDEHDNHNYHIKLLDTLLMLKRV